MTKKFYSYYSLLRKDAGFNCLASLACVYKSTRCNVTIYKNNPTYGTYAKVSLLYIDFLFVPLAELVPGVLIRGGILKNDSTGEFYLPHDNSGVYPGAYLFLARSFGGGGSAGTDILHSYYSYGYETPRLGTGSPFTNYIYAEIHETNDATRPASRLQFDPATFEGSVDLRFNSQLLAAGQDRFKIDYPSQDVGLNSLDSVIFGEVLTFQGDTSKNYQTITIGDTTPNEVIDLENVLFTIPFIRTS